MKNATVTSLLWMLMVSGVQAAGFDCNKASTKIEKEICNDSFLSRLDDDLYLAYLRALERTDDRKMVQKEQQQWLKEVRDACPIEGPCLMEEIGFRTEALNEIPTHKCYWLEPMQDSKGKLRSFEPICRDMEENLNQFCDQPPMACELKIAPQFKGKFTFPKWETIGKEVTPELIEEFLRAPWADARITDQDKDELWNEDRPEVVAAFSEKRLTFMKAELDLYNLGRVHTAYRLDYGNCQARNPDLNNREEWNAPINLAPIRIQYGPEVIRPLFREYSRVTDSLLRGELFQYDGKTYVYLMHGHESEKAPHMNTPEILMTPRRNWLVINRSESLVFPGDDKVNLRKDNICYFNYKPLGG